MRFLIYTPSEETFVQSGGATTLSAAKTVLEHRDIGYVHDTKLGVIVYKKGM